MAKHNPFELERVSVRLVRDSGGPLISDVPLNSPKMVAKLLYNEIFADLDREIFAVVNLKTNLEAVGMKVLATDSDKKIRNLSPSSINICSMGSLDASVVHPREVLKSSILNNAHAVFLIHNHPSGKLVPSIQDIQITDRLIQAYDLMDIEVLDHIILGPHEQYYSFRDNAILPLPRNSYTTNLDDIHFSGKMEAETEATLPGSEKNERHSESALNRLQDAKDEVKKTGQEKPKRNSKKKTKEESL